MRLIGDLVQPSAGSIRVKGKSPQQARLDRDYGIVFQAPVLYEWRTVIKNVQLPLEVMKFPRSAWQPRSEEMLELVGLSDFRHNYPWQLSGGMQQRVAIARALAYQPSILLMDEPFASVDAQTRADLEDLILRVRDQYGITILFVTHDIDESVYLADRVVVLTHSPTRVKEIVAVHLPGPRDQITTKELPEFVNLRGHVYRLIRRELAPVAEVAAVPDTGTPV